MFRSQIKYLKKSASFFHRFYNSNSKKPAPGQYVDIGTHKIHYELIGHGEHHVMLFPGGIGFSRQHWAIQCQTMNRDKFTLIAWDPPGLGYSSPPYNLSHEDFLHRDAEAGIQLLKALGVPKVSVMGWCGGGVVASIAAYKISNILDKLVLVSTTSRFNQGLLDLWDKLRDMRNWGEDHKKMMLDFYSLEFVQPMWPTLMKSLHTRYKNVGGDVCSQELSQIQCPALVFHNRDDTLVPVQCGREVQRLLKNSKMIEMEGKDHQLHVVHAKRFNQIVEDFLLDETTIF